MPKEKSVTLMKSQDDRTWDRQSVRVGSGGNLVLTHYAVGSRCQRLFGCDDMEWNLVVKTEDKPRFLAALLDSAHQKGKVVPGDGDSDDRILAAMTTLYSGDDEAYTHFEEWLIASALPFTRDAWHGC